jgi:hypothetical protein
MEGCRPQRCQGCRAAIPGGRGDVAGQPDMSASIASTLDREMAVILTVDPLPAPTKLEVMDFAGAVEVALQDMVQRGTLPAEVRDELWLIHRPLLLLKIRSQRTGRKPRHVVIGRPPV